MATFLADEIDLTLPDSRWTYNYPNNVYSIGSTGGYFRPPSEGNFGVGLTFRRNGVALTPADQWDDGIARYPALYNLHIGAQAPADHLSTHIRIGINIFWVRSRTAWGGNSAQDRNLTFTEPHSQPRLGVDINGHQTTGLNVDYHASGDSVYHTVYELTSDGAFRCNVNWANPPDGLIDAVFQHLDGDGHQLCQLRISWRDGTGNPFIVTTPSPDFFGDYIGDEFAGPIDSPSTSIAPLAVPVPIKPELISREEEAWRTLQRGLKDIKMPGLEWGTGAEPLGLPNPVILGGWTMVGAGTIIDWVDGAEDTPEWETGDWLKDTGQWIVENDDLIAMAILTAGLATRYPGARRLTGGAGIGQGLDELSREGDLYMAVQKAYEEATAAQVEQAIKDKEAWQNEVLDLLNETQEQWAESQWQQKLAIVEALGGLEVGTGALILERRRKILERHVTAYIEKYADTYGFIAELKEDQT